MPSDKSQNVQDVFLNYIRKQKIPVTVFLVNGVKLQGIATWFDNFSVLLRRDGHTQLVYKHAISTIMPSTPIQLFEPEKDPDDEEQIGGRLNLQADTQGNGNERPEGGDVCIVIHPDLSKNKQTNRSPDAGLQEGSGLASAIDLKVVYSEIIRVNKPNSPTLLGSGAVERIGKIVTGGTDGCTGCNVVIINATLSPIQQRNLERAWSCKVIDRTGLILEIFGARAQT